MSGALTSPRPARIISMRWIVAATMVALIALIMLSAGALSERNARIVLTAQIQSRLLVQSQNLALTSSGAMTSDFPELTLQPIVNEMLQRQPELAFAAVVDLRGVVQGHSDTRLVGAAFVPPPGLKPESGAKLRDPGAELAGNKGLLVASTPVVAPGGGVIGRSYVGQRRDDIDRTLGRARREQLIALGGFLLVGVASAFVLVTLLLRPLAALRAGIERIGRGDLETPLVIGDRTELGAFAGTINRMAAELRVAQTKMVERERLAHEMALAQQIQVSLLPPCRIVAGRYILDGGQRAAAEVGGDYYDMVDLPDGKIGLVVADVSGKGLAGSLVTAMLNALLRALAPSHRSPAALLLALNGQLGRLLDRKSFVTMFYGVLDPERDVLTFASAGHNPLLILRARGSEAEWMRVRGPALGALRSARVEPKFEEAEVRLEPGDVVVQYTDGISEATGEDGSTQFGLDRLAQGGVAALAGGGPAVLRAISASVEVWRAGTPQDDDETLLVISRNDAVADAADSESGVWDLGAALTHLSEAEARGKRLSLPATSAALVRLDDWLSVLPVYTQLAERAASLVRLALHEACANIVEHACGSDPVLRYDLWWVPAPEGGGIATGWFLLRDRGQSFAAEAWRPSELSDPGVRRRGRGLGLDILHRVSRRLAYRADTPEGNLMLLAFDVDQLHAKEAAS